ncbi:MAG: glycine cleavage system aminomethyltransferase GcvT [Rhodothermia bacterium]
MKIKTTPLHQIHMQLGARMMAFGGYEMPVQYSSITDEHLTVRNGVGVFDVSHMGEFLVSGPSAGVFVQELVSNDVSKLYDGKAMYALMCNERGGVVDDLLVYRLAEDRFLLVVNAANIEKDFAWASGHNRIGAELVNQSDEYGLIAVQGPDSTAVVQALTAVDLGTLKFYHFARSGDGGRLPSDVIVSRTGYTGEVGYELYCNAVDSVDVWHAVFEAGADAGIKPVGLGARDTLRLESGYCLYGNDLDDDTNPFEAGLDWATKLDKGAFVGSDALARIKQAGPNRRLVSFVMDERGIPRSGYPILDQEGLNVGVVTSGTQSPVLKTGIGMGYVDNRENLTASGSNVLVEVRGKMIRGTTKKPPLHK